MLRIFSHKDPRQVAAFAALRDKLASQARLGSNQETLAIVQQIVASVRRRGQRAVIRHTQKLDGIQR